MSTIENLNFKVIIDEKEFDAQIDSVKKKAKELNTSLTKILNIKSALASLDSMDAKNAEAYNKALNDQLAIEKRLNYQRRSRVNIERDINNVLSQRPQGTSGDITINSNSNNNTTTILGNPKTTEELGKQSRLLREVTSLAASYFSIYGAQKLVSNLVRVSAEFELQRTTLRAILQDAQGADRLFEQIKELAVKSPFAFKELATYAKQLSAYSIPMNELYDTTKMLADVSAGLGVGMDRLVLAYGQIRSASFLRGQEVRQLTEAGIPILEELRKQFVALGEESITVGDVFDKISTRQVTFEMVAKVFKEMTSEGGKFYQMQEVQAETLRGKISNLADAYEIMFSEIGDKNSGFLKGVVDLIRSLAANYERVGQVLVGLIATYGTYKTLLALVTIAQKYNNIATLTSVSNLQLYTKILKEAITRTRAYIAVQKFLKGFNWAALGVAAFVGVTAAIAKAVVEAAKFNKELDEIGHKHLSDTEKLTDEFFKLANKLKGATVGSQEYRDAISKINNQYGEYLPKLLSERNALDEIAKSQYAVVEAIKARAKANAEAEGLKKIEDRFGEKLQKVTTNFVESLNLAGLGEEQAVAFAKAFRQKLSQGDDDVANALREFFGDKEIVTNMGERFANVAIYARQYDDVLASVNKETEKFERNMDIIFGDNAYTSEAERRVRLAGEEWYNAQKTALDKLALPIEEYQQKLDEINLTKLIKLRNTFQKFENEAEESGKKGAWANIIKELSDEINALKPKDLTWLQKVVNPLVSGTGNNDLKAQDTDTFSEYLDNIRKSYKDITEEYIDAENAYKKLNESKKNGEDIDTMTIEKAQSNYELLLKRKQVIESILNSLGASVKQPKGSTAKSEEEKSLEVKIASLQRIKKEFDKIRAAGLSKGDALELLAKYYPEEKATIALGNFDKQLSDLADTIETKYKNKRLAQSVRDSLGLTKVDEALNIIKEEEKILNKQRQFQDHLNQWVSSGGTMSGEGTAFNVSKIVVDYKNKLKEINDKRISLTKEAQEQYVESFKSAKTVIPSSTFADTLETIMKEEATRVTNSTAGAVEAVRKLADSWVKEWAVINGVKMDDWSQMTITQLESVKKALMSFYNEDGSINTSNLPKDIETKLQDIPGAFESFLEAIKQTVGNGTDKNSGLLGILLGVEDKTRLDMVKNLTNDFLSLADSIRGFADKANLSSLVGVMDTLLEVADTVKAAEEGFAEGGEIGAASAVVTSVLGILFDALSETMQFQKALNDARISALKLKYEMQLADGTETFLGENEIRKIGNAINVINDLKDTVESYGNMVIDYNSKNTKWTDFLYIPFALGKLAVESIKKDSIDLQKIAEETGMSLYDSYGLVNSELIDIALQYPNLSEESRYNLEKMKADIEGYENALDQLEEAMESALGSTVSNMVDEMYDSFLACGDAAADVNDSISEWSTSLAKAMVKSVLMEQLMEDYKEQFMNTYEAVANGELSAEEKAQKMQELAYALQEGVNNAADYANSLFSALKDINLLTDTSGNSLGAGIKGITEDTANLLASYVNAIRADVSYIRMLEEGMSEDLRLIAGEVQTPKLSEYLIQIQANTYDNAVATREILSTLSGVVSNEGSGNGIRTYMQ